MREFYRPADGSEETSTDLNEVAELTVEHTRPRWQTETAARGVFIEMKTELRKIAPVAADETQVRDALANLILNAVDAMPGGGRLTLRTRKVRGRAALAVTDTGAGMTEEIRRRCLEPFFSTKGNRGTGLGLSVVYGMVTRHSGSISIDSTPGKGTTVTIFLPLARRAKTRPDRVKAARPMRPMRILFVDDEPSARRLIHTYLSTDEHLVELAASGREALERFKKGTFDLVITDRAMPRMGGDQVATRLKEIDPDVPVIMLTGFGDLMEDREELPPAVDMLVAKPVVQQELREAIARVARR